MATPSLHLAGGTRYTVSPVVVFSILDYFKRREKQERVMGTLLGEKKGDQVYITNCYRVPHKEEDDERVVVDMDAHQNMLALHTRVNPREVVIGWWYTTDKFGYTTSLLHQAYESQIPDPVLLTVDTALTNSRMSVKAFTGRTLKLADKPVIVRFERAPLSYEASDAERIGVDAMLNAPADDKRLDAPGPLLSDVESLEHSLGTLLDSLEAASAYVQRVVEGKQAADPEVGRAIAGALAAVPNLDPAHLDRVVNTAVQDLLSAMYLANLTRAQLALADKLASSIQ